MADRNRRKELKSAYRQIRREAGVYRIVNRNSGKALIGAKWPRRGVAHGRRTVADPYSPPAAQKDSVQ